VVPYISREVCQRQVYSSTWNCRWRKGVAATISMCWKYAQGEVKGQVIAHSKKWSKRDLRKKVQHLSWHSLSCTAGIESTEFALKVSWQYVHSFMERRAANELHSQATWEEVDLGMRLGHSLKERAWEWATTFYLISPRLSVCCVHGSTVVPAVKCLARTHWHLQSETIQLAVICKQWTPSKYSRTLLIWTPFGP